jgi:hypothetical protein
MPYTTDIHVAPSKLLLLLLLFIFLLFLLYNKNNNTVTNQWKDLIAITLVTFTFIISSYFSYFNISTTLLISELFLLKHMA